MSDEELDPRKYELMVLFVQYWRRLRKNPSNVAEQALRELDKKLRELGMEDD